ncbi:MAG: dATP pyrophosphohydrolase [Geminicoccaceae bacterium]
MSAVTITQVASKGDLRHFLTMPAALYADDPNWVHPLVMERMDHLNAAKNPFLDGIDIAYFLAWRDGRCVGRISAQHDRPHLERHKDATGHFGFFEAEDDAEVVATLLHTVEAWLRERGLRRLTGPFSVSINDESGLLIDGFDTPPNMMMGHHRRYYGPRLEEQGLVPIKDLICYDFDLQADWPPKAKRMLDRMRKLPGLRVRRIDFKNLDAELELLRDIFNDAWANNWGFVPFTAAQMRYLGRSIKPLISPDWISIAELDGEPVAMVVTLPDLNEAIRDLNGRLLPFGWAKLLWRLKVKGVSTGRMPLMGVRRRFHDSPKGAALALSVIEAARDFHAAQGRKHGELSWVLADNRRMRDIIEAVGGVPNKTYRVYEKAIA